jgi:opacity protein-like surface antigen
MNKLVLLSFTALTAFVMADDVIALEESQMISDSCSKPCNPPPPPQPCKPKPPVCKKPCPPVPVCNNTLCSAAPMSENGWYVFADALYWHADVGNSDWAFTNTNTSTPVISGNNHALNFKWGWGFRAGVGANMDYDQWDTNFYYTWFRTENSNAAGSSGLVLSGDIMGLAGTFTTGTIDWRINFSMLDWELGRWFYVSKNLALRPHIGIKGGWISQHIREKFTGTPEGDYLSKTKNDFWGVGASGGFNTTWNFATVGTHHFDFFGDFAGALMYGHFDVKHSEVGTMVPTGGAIAIEGFVPSGLSRNLMVPMLQAIFGLSWDTGFNCNRCHFTFRAGYEFQYWFRQNQMTINEVDPHQVIHYQRNGGDFGLQGLTLDFRFDF